MSDAHVCQKEREKSLNFSHVPAALFAVPSITRANKKMHEKNHFGEILSNEVATF